MKLLTQCIICFIERVENAAAVEASEVVVDFTGAGTMYGTCTNGHRAAIAIQERNFEILFELGGMALLDGYTREAVTSFAAALERAMYFYAEIALLERPNRDAAVAEMHRAIGHLSERQLGAFIALYTYIEGAEPPRLSKTQIEFRNDCVHKGFIPTEERTINFAQSAMQIVDTLIDVMRANHAVALRLATIQHMNKQFDRQLEGMAATTIPTMVSLSRFGPNTRLPINDRLQQLRDRRERFWRA